MLLQFEERTQFGVGQVEQGQASLLWVEGSLLLFKELLVDSKVRADLRERVVRDEFAEVEAELDGAVASGKLTGDESKQRLELYRADLVKRLDREKTTLRALEMCREMSFREREKEVLARVRLGALSEEQGLLELRAFWSGLRAEAVQ